MPARCPAGATRKLGAGTLTLSGDSSAYTGAASIVAGTLQVDGKLGGKLLGQRRHAVRHRHAQQRSSPPGSRCPSRACSTPTKAGDRAAALAGLGILIQPLYIIHADIVAGSWCRCWPTGACPRSPSTSPTKAGAISRRRSAFTEFLMERFERLGFARKERDRAIAQPSPLPTTSSPREELFFPTGLFPLQTHGHHCVCRKRAPRPRIGNHDNAKQPGLETP